MNKRMAFGCVSVILGLVLLALTASDAIGMLFDRVKIEDKDYTNYEGGEIVDAKLTYVLGNMGTVKAKKKLFGIPYKTVDASLYLIQDNGGWVIIEACEDTAELDRAAEQTAQYFANAAAVPTASVDFTGKAVEINDDQLSAAIDYFSGVHIDSEVWQNATSLYVLVQFDAARVTIQLCIAGCFILIGVILLIAARRNTFGETVYVGEEPPAQENTAESAEAAASAEEASDSEEE